MNLDALLAEVDGIGGDQFIHSPLPERQVAAKVTPEHATIPADLPDTDLPVPSSPFTVHDSSMMGGAKSIDTAALALVSDVEFEIQVELGQARVPLKMLMDWKPGDRFTLDQHPDELLKLYIDDQLIGRGEALIVNNMLAVRIVELTHHAINPDITP